MDNYLRRMKRLVSQDPTLKDQYIRALERVAGVESGEECDGMFFTSDGRRLKINYIKIIDPNDGLIVGFHRYGEFGNTDTPIRYDIKSKWEKELSEWSGKRSGLNRTPGWVRPGQEEPDLPEAVGKGFKLIDPDVPDSEKFCPIYRRMQVDTLLQFHTKCCWFYSHLRLVFFPTYDELKLSPQYLIEREMEKLNWYEIAVEQACD